MSISSVLIQFVIHVIWNVICASALADLNPRRSEDPEEELSVRVYMQSLKLSEPLRYTLQDPVKHCLTNKFKLPDPVIFFSEQESELPSPPSPTYRGLSGKVHWSEIAFNNNHNKNHNFYYNYYYYFILNWSKTVEMCPMQTQVEGFKLLYGYCKGLLVLVNSSVNTKP